MVIVGNILPMVRLLSLSRWVLAVLSPVTAQRMAVTASSHLTLALGVNIAFMKDPASTQYLEDLRLALVVMEEGSHLGLDDQYATVVRNAIVRRIAVAENQPGYKATARLSIKEELCV